MTSSRTFRTRAVAALVVCCAAPRLQAQSSHSAAVAEPCEQVARPEQAERAMKILSTSDATLRESLGSVGITPQRADAPRGVLRSTPACARLRASLRKVIRTADLPAEGLREAPLSFLELGDYYGVIVTSGEPPTSHIRRGGAAPLYLFDRETMRFVARLAI